MPAAVKRGKTGCVTCRIRRVKCDEARPHCKRCTSTGRKCDGYSTLPFSRRDLQAASKSASQRDCPSPTSYQDTDLLSRLVVDPAFSDVLEKRYFQFFRQRTLASTNSLEGSHFWDRTVLQACHSVPAIKHAVLALSSWHQFRASTAARKANPQHSAYADRQYHKALVHARDLVSSADSHEVDKVLMTCIVFICYEGVRGNYKASQLHMDNGRAIAKQHADLFRQNARRNDLLEIQHALARMDLSAICFSDTSSPYQFTVKDFVKTELVLKPWQFSNIHEARTCLVDLIRWHLVANQYMIDTYFTGDTETLARLQKEKEKRAGRLQLWHDYFEKVVETTDPCSELLILNLRQWYSTCQAISKAECVGSETRWDDVELYFEKIISLSEEIVQRLQHQDGGTSFSCGIAFTMGIFLAATRCRNPNLRRRAIQVLWTVPHGEGVWATLPAAAMAQRWMEVEEEGLSGVKSASDVPEWKRVRMMRTSIHAVEKKAEISFTLCDGSGNVLQRAGQVVWASLKLAQR